VPYSTRHTCYTVSNFRQMCVTDAHPRNTITKKPVNKSISKRIMFGRLSMSCVVEPIRFQDLLKLSKNAKASAENALRNFGTRSTREVPRRLPRVASRNREHCTQSGSGSSRSGTHRTPSSPPALGFGWPALKAVPRT